MKSRLQAFGHQLSDQVKPHERGLLTALLVIATFLVNTVVIFAAGDHPNTSVLQDVIGNVFLGAGLIWWLYLAKGGIQRFSRGKPNQPWRIAAWTIPAFLLVQRALMYASFYTMHRINHVVSQATPLLSEHPANLPHPSLVSPNWDLISSVIAAPLIEECLMRFWLYGSLRNKVGRWPAAIISASVWAALHVPRPLSALLIITTFGLVLAWLYEWTGSIWPGVLMHALWNLSLVVPDLWAWSAPAAVLVVVALVLRRPPKRTELHSEWTAGVHQESRAAAPAPST